MRKGLIPRPCVRCGVMVRFMPWGPDKWHWEHEAGTHHICGPGAQKRGARPGPSLEVRIAKTLPRWRQEEILRGRNS